MFNLLLGVCGVHHGRVQLCGDLEGVLGRADDQGDDLGSPAELQVSSVKVRIKLQPEQVEVRLK